MPDEKPDQFRNRIELLLSQPEGQFLEFKQTVSGKMDKELVAFANSGGGIIIVGIDDFGKIHGIHTLNADISKIESIARNCDPSIQLSIQKFRYHDKDLLIINIPDGHEKPHSCSSGFFLRSGTTSQKMTRDEIISFLHVTERVNFEEKPCLKFNYPKDFDEEAFRQFIALAGISKGGMSTEELLENLGVVNREGTRLIFNNAGVLFFAREPTRFLRHAVVDCILFQGTDKVDILDRKELKFNLMENVRQAMIFLKLHLPLKYEITGLVRKEILEIPDEALREAVLNAVIHRDYHFDSANISIEIYRDRVEISDPGGLPPGMRFEDLGSKSVRRNKILADLFHRIGEVEKVGSGIGRIREALANAGLPELDIAITGFYTISFQRGKEKSVQVTEQVTDQVTEQVKRLIEGLGNDVLTGKELMKKLHLSHRPTFLYSYLQPALEAGLVEMTIPEKPRSSKQQYQLTAQGMTVKEKLQD